MALRGGVVDETSNWGSKVEERGRAARIVASDVEDLLIAFAAGEELDTTLARRPPPVNPSEGGLPLWGMSVDDRWRGVGDGRFGGVEVKAGAGDDEAALDEAGAGEEDEKCPRGGGTFVCFCRCAVVKAEAAGDDVHGEFGVVGLDDALLDSTILTVG